MDFISAPIHFTSRLYPDATFTLNRPTKRTAAIAARAATSHAKNRFDIQEEDMAVGVFKSYLLDFDGVTIDGAKPSIERLALDGPLDLVNELIEEIGRISDPMSVTDAADKAIIAAAEKRIAKRKNSAPASSSATTAAGTNDAESVSETASRPESSETREIAMGAPV